MRLALFALLAASGCHSSSMVVDGGHDLAMAPDLALPAADLAFSKKLITDRPYMEKTPSGYDASKPWPLILALHGLGDSGANLAQGLGLLALADQRGFFVAYPDGSPTGFGGGYWNANDVCCQLGSPVPDDVAYLNAVVSDMQGRFNIDPKRTFVMGLSNGGMMAHRLGCDSSDRFSAIVSLSGAQATDASTCKPAVPVAVLEVHGTADTTVPYNGGPTLQGLGPAVISAHQTINVWVTKNGCNAMPDTAAPPFHFDASLQGMETSVENWKGCKPGGAAELWTVKGGMHIPMLAADAPGRLYDWLTAHARN
jgi:polyhydroxybutyrate depolymerase